MYVYSFLFITLWCMMYDSQRWLTFKSILLTNIVRLLFVCRSHWYCRNWQKSENVKKNIAIYVCDFIWKSTRKKKAKKKQNSWHEVYCLANRLFVINVTINWIISVHTHTVDVCLCKISDEFEHILSSMNRMNIGKCPFLPQLNTMWQSVLKITKAN